MPAHSVSCFPSSIKIHSFCKLINECLSSQYLNLHEQHLSTNVCSLSEAKLLHAQAACLLVMLITTMCRCYTPKTANIFWMWQRNFMGTFHLASLNIKRHRFKGGNLTEILQLLLLDKRHSEVTLVSAALSVCSGDHHSQVPLPDCCWDTSLLSHHRMHTEGHVAIVWRMQTISGLARKEVWLCILPRKVWGYKEASNYTMGVWASLQHPSSPPPFVSQTLLPLLCLCKKPFSRNSTVIFKMHFSPCCSLTQNPY